MTHTFRAAQQPDGPVGQRPLGQGMLLLRPDGHAPSIGHTEINLGTGLLALAGQPFAPGALGWLSLRADSSPRCRPNRTICSLLAAHHQHPRTGSQL